MHCADSSVIASAKGDKGRSEGVQYGNDWYRQTKAPRRTVRDELGVQQHPVTT